MVEENGMLVQVKLKAPVKEVKGDGSHYQKKGNS